MQIKDAETAPHLIYTGTGAAMHSNRISHFFDLQGPSMSIDTGCSSGMVALHQACQSLRSGESNISIACAANMLLVQDAFIAASGLGTASAEGRCFTWDDRASGYGRGEGVSALILKPLDAALRDGDQVHSIIRTTGLNQDGKTTTITSPSTEAQIKLIRECYRRTGLDFSDTGYVEAHGTGTQVGDTIEAEALAKTFGSSREENDPIIVGSVKTNIGHTEPVSGLAAIIKATFALKHAIIPPNLNYITTNPAIRLRDWHLQVPTTPIAWPKNKLLRASVNNFGYGGTNGHAILESPHTSHAYCKGSPVGQKNPNEGQQSRVFVVSAKDVTACQNSMQRLAAWIEDNRPSPDDLAFTLCERRTLLPWRTVVRAKSLDELVDQLRNSSRKPILVKRRPRLGFVFNGQGAQWHAMGRELMFGYPLFAHTVAKASGILAGYGATWSLMLELLREQGATRVADIALSQPMTVALQLCLVDLLKSWGISPSAVTSHSSGEVAAAYAVGALTFEEALGVAYFRGSLAQKYQALSTLAGGMLAAGIDSDTAGRYIRQAAAKGRVVVACVNSPSSVTLSGDLEAIDEIASQLEKDGFFARKLKVPMAYHSHHTYAMAEEYTDKLRAILSTTSKKGLSEVLYASPVTGDLVASVDTLGAEHWVRNLTNPVLFSQAFESMCFTSPQSKSKADNVDLIVEIGAHSTLAGPIRQILKARGVELPYVSCLQRSVDAMDTMQDLVCVIQSHGYPVDLTAVNAPDGTQGLRFVPNLPSYPWDHSKRYWVESRITKDQKHKRFPPHELLGTLINGSNGRTPTWRTFLRLSEIEWLCDHQVDSNVVFPGAGYIAMAIEAIRLLTDASEETIRSYQLRDIDILNALVIPETQAQVEVHFCLRPCSENKFDGKCWYEFELTSLSSGDVWIEHCRGYVTAETSEKDKTPQGEEELSVDAESFFASKDKVETVNLESFFADLRGRGIYHGPQFRHLIDSCAGEGRAVTNFEIADFACKEHRYALHPTTLDSILQASFSTLCGKLGTNSMALPRYISSISIPRNFSRDGGDRLRAFTKLVKSEKQGHTSDVTIVTTDSEQPSAIQIRDFFAQVVTRSFEPETTNTTLCSKSCWEPDMLHKVPEAFKNSLIKPLQRHEAELQRTLVRTCYYLIEDAVSELSGQNTEAWSWHHKRLYSWMKSIVDHGQRGELAPGSQAWSPVAQVVKEMLYNEMNASGAVGQLTVGIGKQLASIIRGETPPLEVMRQDNLLDRFYIENDALGRAYPYVKQLAELYAIKTPGARILEIGAGTGGATTHLLEAFGTKGDGAGSLIGDYTFTDISSGFFEAAKSKFASWLGLMDFKRLDIEVDPLEQGFTAGSYDLILASECLHATRNLHHTMAHVRKLLKPGGTLMLIEATANRIADQLIFGTLPQWWIAEEPERQISPIGSLDMWNRVLRETGFTGVDLDVCDYEDPEFQTKRVILSRALKAISASVSVVVRDLASASQPWLSELVDAVAAKTGVRPKVTSLDDIETIKNSICLFLGEMESPFVDGIDATSFEKLKQMMFACSGLLWISCGGAVDASKPSFAATEGLLRVLRLEDAGKRSIRLDFEDDGDVWSSGKIAHIVHVLEQSFDPNVAASDVDWEYAVRKDMLHVARVFPDRERDMIAKGLRGDEKVEVSACSHYSNTDADLNDQNDGTLPLFSLDNPDATYMIVGGLTGIGHSIALWMMSNNARNMVLVSRHATSHPGAAEMREIAEKAGCRLMICDCDTADESSFLKLLDDCSKSLPPIRGVINGAMVLDDSLLERMTFKQWCKAVQPKINSSQNMHNHLSDLTFFIMLSSLTGAIGFPTQANYAAGNSFQDALARHRTSLGLPAVSINLPVVLSVGLVAEREAKGDDRVRAHTENSGLDSIDIDGVLRIIEGIIREPLLKSPQDSQIIVGINSRIFAHDSGLSSDRRFGTLRIESPRKQRVETSKSTKTSTAALVQSLVRTSSPSDAISLLEQAIANKLADVFNIPVPEIQYDLPLSQYGVDSLVAVDLRNWLSATFKAKMSVFEILQIASLTQCALLVADRSEYVVAREGQGGVQEVAP